MAKKKEDEDNEEKNEKKIRFVKNYNELATELEVAYKTVMRWKKEASSPQAAADGRHNVQEWRKWSEKNGKKQPETAQKADLADEGQKLKNKKLEMELAEKEGRLLEIDEVCNVISSAFAEVMKLRDVKHSLGPQLGGLEVGERVARIGEAMDDALRGIVLPQQIKKKVGYETLFNLFYDLQKQYGLGNGLSDT